MDRLVKIQTLGRRLNKTSFQQKTRRKMGNHLVDSIINIIHEQHKILSFEERDEIVENLCQTIFFLQETVEKYFDYKEQAKSSSTPLVPFEDAKEVICGVGKNLKERNCEMYELLTCDVPLFRTIAAIYTEISNAD